MGWLSRGAAVGALGAAALLGCDRARGAERYADEVADAVPRVERAVGLPFKSPPKVATASSEQVRAYATQQLQEARVLRELAGVEAAYKLFGLLPDTLDLRATVLELLSEQIAGYYDPESKTLYVRAGASEEEVGITLTHELVHALQDQYVDLAAIQDMEGDNDRKSALAAVIEGQATYEQFAIMLGDRLDRSPLGNWDDIRQMIRTESSRMPVFGSAPVILQESLIFPYLSGAEFMRRFEARRPGKVPFDSMPASTEQVMHAASYFGTRDAPTVVTLPPPRSGPLVYENNLGEFETRILLYQHLRDLSTAVRGAAGWDGDRYAVVETPRGRALVWVTVWDSPVEAGEFLDVFGDALARRYGAGTDTAASAGAPRFQSRGRAAELSAVELQGRPAVVYVDRPADFVQPLLDLRQVRLRQ